MSASEGVDLIAVNNSFSCDAADGSTTFGRGGVIHQRPAGSTSAAWGSFYAAGNKFTNIGKAPDQLGCLYSYSGARSVTFIGNTAISPYGATFTAKADAQSCIITGNTVIGQRYSQSSAFVLFGQGDTYTTTSGHTVLFSSNIVDGAEGNAFNIDGLRQGGALAKFKTVVFADNVATNCLRAFRLQDLENFKASGTVATDCQVFCFATDELDGHIEFINSTVLGTTTTGFNFAVTDASTADLVIDGMRVELLSAVFLTTDETFKSISVSRLNIGGASSLFSTNGTEGKLSFRDSEVRGVAVGSGFSAMTGTYGSIEWRGNRGLTRPLSLSVLSVASGAITVTMGSHKVGGEGGVTDTLDTINGGDEGDFVTLYGTSNTAIVTVSGGGNLYPAGGVSFALDSTRDTITFMRRDAHWAEISRATNGS